MKSTSSNASSWLNFAQRSREEGGLGLAPHQAAGLVGNLVNESGQDLTPWGPTGDNGTAWGTAQWRGDRLARLKARPDFQTVEGQQAFMREELDGSENRAYKALLAATTPEEAAHAWDKNYERSDGSTREQRMRSARDLMAQFGGDTAFQPGALTTSYASTESKPSMPTPALSADTTAGPGILNMSGANTDDDNVARALIGMGASLSGITSPEQGKALAAQQALLAKAPGNKWSVAHVDPKTGQALLTNGTQFVPWKAFQPKPDEDTYVDEARRSTAKGNQEYGASLSDQYAKIAGTAGDVGQLRTLLSNPSVYQGAGGDWVQDARKIFHSMGFGSSEGIADADVARALSNKLALKLVKADESGSLLPGSFSDSDRKYVQQMTTSLNNDPTANQRLLDIYERTIKRAQEAEGVRAKHVEANDGIYRPSIRSEIGALRDKWVDEDKSRDVPLAAPKATKPANTFKTKSGITWSY